MRHFVTRVNEWNAARYEQELDHKLATDLLTEEASELYEADMANNHVEVLDALGDIVFVAVGILWKAKLPEGAVIAFFEGIPYASPASVQQTYFVKQAMGMSTLLGEEVDIEVHATVAKALVAILNVVDIMSMLNFSQKLKILMDIICNSNDTKAVPSEKVDASVKANTDKGEDFVPPTEALEQFKTQYWTREAITTLDEEDSNDAQ